MTIIFVMYHTGVRPREITRAKLEYLDITKGTLYIPGGNNKQREDDIIPLTDFVIQVLYQYLEIRKGHSCNGCPWLFPNISGQPIDRSTLAQLFKRAVKKAGLYKLSYIDKQGHPRGNLSLYSLRHSFATNAYLKLKDIRKVALLLRHRDYSCRSTMRYLHSAQELKYKDILDEVYQREDL